MLMPKATEKLPEIKHFFRTVCAGIIVVATSYKAGTNWVHAIVGNLIFSGDKLPGSIDELSPWLDHRLFPLELMLTRLERQTHRRLIKTHLPLDSLPFHRNIKD
jgi:aryl sulfotransferase